MFRKSEIAGAVILGLALSGCSGGGGTSSGDDDADKVVTTQTQTVSGSVTLSSLVGDSAAAAKANEASTSSVSTTSATIELLSYEKDGTLTESRQLMASDKGVFSGQLTLHTAEAGGGYVVINVKSPGTSGWSKRINYSDPADLDVNAELRVAQTVVHNLRGEGGLTAAVKEENFRFGVIRYADGSKQALAGSAAIAAAKAANPAANMELDIVIPASDLPETETLMANLITFDPSNNTDAQSFPGDYLDSDGNRLVSVGFDSVEITDDAGKSVADLAGAALTAGTVSKANSSGVSVTRWIPSGTCSSVEDFWEENMSADGSVSQVPIYTYNPNKGVWDLLGDGRVQTYNTDTSGYTDTNTFNMTSCTNGAYYMTIDVTSEDYINAWWNLDYPILTAEPTTVCSDVTFKDADGANLSGIYAELSGTGLSRVSGSSNASGKLELSAMVTSSASPPTATVSYWNPYDYSYQTVTGVNVGSSCVARDVVVAKPRQCHVAGTVSGGAANEYVWAYSANPYAYGWAYTNAEGQFNARVRCDVDMDLYLGNSEVGSFRVDGIQAGNEVTDDGSVANMGTIAKVNTPPYAYGYLSSYSVKVSELDATANVTAYVYGWDADGAGDYPLSYEVSDVTPTVPTVLASGSISQNEGFVSTSLSGLTADSYNLSLKVTDGSDNATTVALGNLEVVSGNRPPVISYAYTSVGSSVRLNKDGSLPSINLYAHSYDPDGDTLTRGWTCTDCLQALAGNLNNDEFVGGAGYSAGNSLTFTYTTTDIEGASVSRDRVVDILPAVNNTPYFVSSSLSETVVNAVPESIPLSVTVADADGDNLIVTWFYEGNPLYNEPEEWLKADDLAGGSGTSGYTVQLGTVEDDGRSWVFRAELTDGIATVSRTFTVTYQTASSDTTITLQ